MPPSFPLSPPFLSDPQFLPPFASPLRLSDPDLVSPLSFSPSFLTLPPPAAPLAFFCLSVFLPVALSVSSLPPSLRVSSPCPPSSTLPSPSAARCLPVPESPLPPPPALAAGPARALPGVRPPRSRALRARRDTLLPARRGPARLGPRPAPESAEDVSPASLPEQQPLARGARAQRSSAAGARWVARAGCALLPQAVSLPGLSPAPAPRQPRGPSPAGHPRPQRR